MVKFRSVDNLNFKNKKSKQNPSILLIRYKIQDTGTYDEIMKRINVELTGHYLQCLAKRRRETHALPLGIDYCIVFFYSRHV